MGVIDTNKEPFEYYLYGIPQLDPYLKARIQQKHLPTNMNGSRQYDDDEGCLTQFGAEACAKQGHQDRDRPTLLPVEKVGIVFRHCLRKGSRFQFYLSVNKFSVHGSRQTLGQQKWMPDVIRILKTETDFRLAGKRLQLRHHWPTCR